MPQSNITTDTHNSIMVSGLPLQDITETALHDDRFIPNPRPKRKVKAPTGALGQKPRRAVSSLPPSSPTIGPSSSHSLPIASSDDGHHNPQEQQGQGQGSWMDEVAEDDWKENIDFSSQCYDEHGNFVEPQLQDEMEEVPTADDSDPFGFFAVEEKLKAERTKPGAKPLFPQPEPIVQSLNPPRTPHKRRIGKRAVTAPSRSPSPARSDVLPSSPSPAKRPSERFGVAPEADIDFDERSALAVAHDDTPIKADSRRKKPRRGDGPVNPERLAKTLTSLLPRRRRRGKSSRTYKDEDDSEDEEPSRIKRQTRNRRKRRETLKEDEDEETDIDMKMAQERKARSEYFKKLQSYKIAKENVYVV